MVPEVRPFLGPERLPDPPEAWWTRRRTTQFDVPGRPHLVEFDIPQCIAHRGYGAKFPENTMRAFRAAAAVGAHAIETDLHLSRDGVVVLSHDATLKRCFGVNEKIKDCDWEYLSTLRTLKEPHEPMPRLAELLDFMTEDAVNEMWLLLDVKMDDDAEELMSRTAATIAACHLRNARPWNQRIVIGCWTMAYVTKAREFLPTYSLTHIGFSLLYARRFLPVANVSFNLLQKVLVGPFGARFLRKARARDRRVFAWTVNDEAWMRWCVDHGLDGVVTDDPVLFLDVCARKASEPGLLSAMEEEVAGEERDGRRRGTRTTRRTGLRVSRSKGKDSEAVVEKVKRFLDLLLWNFAATIIATLFFVFGWYERAVGTREAQRVFS